MRNGIKRPSERPILDGKIVLRSNKRQLRSNYLPPGAARTPIQRADSAGQAKREGKIKDEVPYFRRNASALLFPNERGTALSDHQREPYWMGKSFCEATKDNCEAITCPRVLPGRRSSGRIPLVKRSAKEKQRTKSHTSGATRRHFLSLRKNRSNHCFHSLKRVQLPSNGILNRSASGC